jgi:hypothetical protein
MFTNRGDTDKAVTFSVLLLAVAALFVGSCGTQGVGR